MSSTNVFSITKGKGDDYVTMTTVMHDSIHLLGVVHKHWKTPIHRDVKGLFYVITGDYLNVHCHRWLANELPLGIISWIFYHLVSKWCFSSFCCYLRGSPVKMIMVVTSSNSCSSHHVTRHVIPVSQSGT